MSYADTAIALDSSNIRAYRARQAILPDLGLDIDTLTLEKILKLKPDSAEEYVVLGGVYERLKRI